MTVEQCFKVLLSSANATPMADGSFRFDNVNLQGVQGDTVRCAVKNIVYPPPATYISRRLWLTNNNTFVNAYTNTLPPVGQRVNDFDTLFAKYGLNNWVYLYYPKKNMYVRLYYNNIFSETLRQTRYSTSTDGVNWSAESNATTIGLLQDVDWAVDASIPFDCYEIDITITPVGTNLQNVHIPEMAMWRSWSSTTKGTTDIVGHIRKNMNFQPYVSNDLSMTMHDTDVTNEVSGASLRALQTMTVYFSRVATPNVKETVALPWLIELALYAV